MSSEGRFYCAHFQEATCMNMVAERAC
ncbi:a5c89bc6-0df2-4ba7-9374-c0b53fb266f1 [Thermothielavioides terrestris]|uniref:A5c89bc6-0df2-4ba7-9374-c0b53fb266f1 n=1 Tax=Thermothielavioides terrestris TaxID=2587410 RepID=A0A446B6J3_9PEZI|nr:a5c89bc6-0df2-4ba7-9374-c0b53fb266f1 [Thermothielavioides terrestris]